MAYNTGRMHARLVIWHTDWRLLGLGTLLRFFIVCLRDDARNMEASHLHALILLSTPFTLQRKTFCQVNSALERREHRMDA